MDYPLANDLALRQEVSAFSADSAEVAEVFALQCEENLDVQFCRRENMSALSRRLSLAIRIDVTMCWSHRCSPDRDLRNTLRSQEAVSRRQTRLRYAARLSWQISSLLAGFYGLKRPSTPLTVCFIITELEYHINERNTAYASR